MRVTQSHMHFLASDFSAVTDAIDVEDAAKSLAHSLSHVGDQFTRQPVQSADLAVILLALDAYHIAIDFDLNAGRNHRLQFSLGSFETNGVGIDRDFDARGNCYR